VRNAAQGCTTVADIYRILGSPPRCGKCVQMVADLCRDTSSGADCAGGSDN